MSKITLLTEYRLIEKCESEVNGAWRGAHLLLFFLAFVFGSFCTFCFHMLMYLFDEKCVLFPRLLSLTSSRNNIIYEFMPNPKGAQDMPVDFLSTQWVEKNTCTLPTYVPLLSGIFGLVWTTMFLMCSSGSRTLTGSERPWRVLPSLFLFSLAMGALCIYSSAITHYGLQDLCIKLGEITGSSTCTYTVNVATLAYERRIRGVYQATRLTILSAWLHTACWILSASLALARVLLAVDFQLVKINVDLHGNIDKILQQHEQQIRTVSPEPDLWIHDEYGPSTSKQILKRNINKPTKETNLEIKDNQEISKQSSEILFLSNIGPDASELSLVPAEKNKLTRRTIYQKYPKDQQFIIAMLDDLVDSIDVTKFSELDHKNSSSSSLKTESVELIRQIGQEKILSENKDTTDKQTVPFSEAKELATDIKYILQNKLESRLIQEADNLGSPISTLNPNKQPEDNSVMDISEELKLILNKLDLKTKEQTTKVDKVPKKSNLKSAGVQTDKGKGRVQISESLTSVWRGNRDNSLSHRDNITNINTKKGVDEKDNTKEDINKKQINKEDNDAKDSMNVDSSIKIVARGDEDKKGITDNQYDNKVDTKDVAIQSSQDTVGTEDDDINAVTEDSADKQTQTKQKEKQD